MPNKLKMSKNEPNEEKLTELILLISELSEGDEYFGSTKLNKLLFFSDFVSYQRTGQSISGYAYKAQPEGPMLNGFYGVRDRLEELGEIVVREKDFWGYSQHRTIALRSAEVSKLTSDELNIVNRVIRQSEDMSAAQISSASHDFIGWQIVDIGEEIPYHTALISARDLTADEWKYPVTQDLELDKVGVDVESLVK